MEDATQTDAEEVVESEEEPRAETLEDKLSAREEMMAKIVDEREIEVLSEVIGEAESIAIESEEEEEIQHEDPTPPVWLKDGTWVTSVKVNGAETTVPFEGLKVSHQKDAASQQRFEEAANKEKWLNEKEAQLRQYVQSLKQKEKEESPPETQGDEPKTDTNFVEVAKEYHQALYEDDADKAAELFKALTNKGRSQPATQNVDEAVQQALQRAMAQQQAQNKRQQQWAYQKSLEDAVKWFDGEYPDVAGTPELRPVADNRTIELTQSNPDWSL
ncbi:hypothetical protein KAI10_09480, partial [Candidatus Bathyarchaeota archaeon]|nr:hypothetical protein [Candidatus Bathyarchaeota archaeon]